MTLHSVVATVTDRIRHRSTKTRAAYLNLIHSMQRQGPQRGALSCTNLAHGFAAFPANDKLALRAMREPSIAVVSSYNDMLSAHQPFERFPAIIKDAARRAGAVAQFAGGTPAMCDGITQGKAGMELSLFSRDVIAMSTGVALSHNMFDAALYLGVCDKIVPGLLIGALHFGHVPGVFIPAGPMSTGISNDDKAKVRQLYAQGKVSRDELLETELKAYHGPGTCTFYGTANSNQMLMEAMGLHLPGAAFVPPNTSLRDALTAAATERAAQITALGDEYTPIGELVDERAIVNAIVALLATGGSTNHTIHLVAIARAAGIDINWDDFSELSDVVPLLARVYPNGQADVNHFHALGGTGFVIRELLDGGFMHDDVRTVAGPGLRRYATEPSLKNDRLNWQPVPQTSGDDTVLRRASEPFSVNGGLKLLHGNLGRAIIKVAAVKPEHRKVRAPAIVFDSQEAMLTAFKAGELTRDFIAVIRYQGPRANGMPELHKLTPALGVLQDQGYRVALVTDGRMSGASGKVPAAIHMTPECVAGGPLSKVRTGDIITLDAERGTLNVELTNTELARRASEVPPPGTAPASGMGRELFAVFRNAVSTAEDGAVSFATEQDMQ